MHRGTVFTFSPGSFYSHSRQRKMSCEFPWKDLTFLVRENSVTSIESWNFIISVFLTVIMQESIIHSNKPIAFKNKNDTACYLLLCLFPWLWLTFRGPFVNHAIKTILCHIVATGNVWLLINFLWRNNLSPCSHYYTSNHHCLYCMYLCWYLIRRACCKWTVSSCEDVSHVWIISRVWNRIKRQPPS